MSKREEMSRREPVIRNGSGARQLPGGREMTVVAGDFFPPVAVITVSRKAAKKSQELAFHTATPTCRNTLRGLGTLPDCSLPSCLPFFPLFQINRQGV